MDEQREDNEMQQNFKGETGMTTNNPANDNVKKRIFGMRSLQMKQKEAAERLAMANTEQDKIRAEQELADIEDVAVLNAAEDRAINKMYEDRYRVNDFDEQEIHEDPNAPISDIGSFQPGILTYTSRMISGVDPTNPRLTTANLVIQTFPKYAVDMLKQIASDMHVHINMVLYGLIVLISTCLQGTVELAVNKLWIERANLFGMLLGETGIGKSSCVDSMLKYLYDIEYKMRTMYDKLRNDYEKKVQEFKKSKGGGNAPHKPINRVVLATTMTIECMAERFQHNPGGYTLYSDELSHYFASLDKYSSAKGEFKSAFISCYTGEPIRNYRKNHDGKSNDTYVKAAIVSLFGNLQPDLLRTIFTKTDMEQGLMQRFFFVTVPFLERYNHDIGNISAEPSAYLKMVTDYLWSIHEEHSPKCLDEDGNVVEVPPLQIEISDEALQKVNAIRKIMFYNIDKYKLLRGFATRFLTMLLRFSIIFHFFRYADKYAEKCRAEGRESTHIVDDSSTAKVSPEDVEIAKMMICFCLEQTDYALWVYNGGMGSDRKFFLSQNQLKVLDHLENNKEFYSDPRTSSEMINNGFPTKALFNLNGRKEVLALGKWLSEEGFKPVPGGTRSTKRYIIYPPTPWMQSMNYKRGWFPESASEAVFIKNIEICRNRMLKYRI